MQGKIAARFGKHSFHARKQLKGTCSIRMSTKKSAALLIYFMNSKRTCFTKQGTMLIAEQKRQKNLDFLETQKACIYFPVSYYVHYWIHNCMKHFGKDCLVLKESTLATTGLPE